MDATREWTSIRVDVPVFPVHEKPSFSFSSLRTCNCLNVLNPAIDELTESPSSLVVGEGIKCCNNFPTSNRASATKDGKQQLYNHSNLVELSANNATCVSFVCFVVGAGVAVAVVVAPTCCPIATTTWKSGTLFLTSLSTSLLLRLHCPPPPAPSPTPPNTPELAASPTSSSSTPSTSLNHSKTFSYFIKHLHSANAVQCCTSGEFDCSPFERWALRDSEGKIFSSMAFRGGGVG